MNYKSAWRIINSELILVERFYEFGYNGSHEDKVKAFFFLNILNSEYYYKKYLDDVAELAAPQHTADSDRVAELVRSMGWLRFRAAVVNYVDINNWDDDETRKKVRKLPGKINSGK